MFENLSKQSTLQGIQPGFTQRSIGSLLVEIKRDLLHIKCVFGNTLKVFKPRLQPP